MPTSCLELAPRLINLIETVLHDRVLDVGPGFGKYGLLLREYLNVKPKRLDCVEMHPGYITSIMHAIYDDVHLGDVTEWTKEQLRHYDVVLLVDVIEHMEKDAGVDLLNRIQGRVVLSTPEEFFEQGGDGTGLPDTEIHRSHWTLADFDRTGRVEFGRIEQGGVIVRLSPAR